MKNLDWFQARSIAREGRAVRRELWRKWLTFEHYVWLITQPVWETQLADRRVVQQWDFGAEEFMARDWTDEPWPNGPQPPEPPEPPNPPDPPRPPKPPLPPGGDGGDGNHTDPLPPDPSNPNNPPTHTDPINGSSGGIGGGWGGFGSSGGDGTPDGPKPPVPPRPPRPPQPPNPNVPTITVEVAADLDTDGPSCFIIPPATCTIYVTVSIAGGPAGVGTLSVSGAFTPAQLSTGWPGMNQSFTFHNVPVNPGGTITFFADYGAPGVIPFIHYIGSGSFTFPPNCLIATLTWAGDSTEVKRCNHGPQTYGGPATDGFDFTANYAVTAAYAIHPEPGAGKTGRDTGVKYADANGNNAHGHYTPYPGGVATDSDWFIAPPASITADVGEDHTLANIAPATLGVFGLDDHDSTPPCTFDRTSHESGPS